MSIIDLQRRIAEVGRIRIGQQVPAGKGTRPTKLDTFRLTSSDRRRIENAAKLYGGTVAAWTAPAGPQWEIITGATQLPVIVPPADMAFSQAYELWSAGGCQRRCDGRTERNTQGQCRCDPDNRECDIHTRLSVMLADLPGLGVWRLDTQGFYAASELGGAVDIIRAAARHGQLLPATLRLEQRVTKRPDQGTRRFAVPVLDIDVAPAALLGASNGGLPEIPAYSADRILDAEIHAIQSGGASLTPVPSEPAWPTASITEQVDAAAQQPSRRRNQLPVPVTGLPPRTVAQAQSGAIPEPASPDPEPPPDDGGGPRPMTEPQRRKMMALLKEGGFTDRAARHDFVVAAIGRPIESSAELSTTEASTVIDLLEKNGQ